MMKSIWLEKEASESVGDPLKLRIYTSRLLGGEPDLVMACCGDVPTLETLAAVELLHEHLPALKVRVVNVVNLMKLQPPSEHPHGLPDSSV